MSLNHDGEQLCGDHVEIVENENSTIVVLADGLGSGVKASILSTLTSTIISTMLAAGLDIRDAVETIADTLPICSERKTAFSTFTIIRLEDNAHADIIQYENPNVILIRNGEQYEFPLSTMKIGEKTIYRSSFELADGDMSGAHGYDTSTFTSYYVTFQVESGDRMEFEVDGSDYGLLVQGDIGKLSFQGTRYLGFERS